MAKHMTGSSSTPTHEQITRRAYEIFIERGQPEGHDLDHWLEAEAQLRAAIQTNGDAQTRTHSHSRSQNGAKPQSRARK